MVDGHVQLPAEGGGKKLDHEEIDFGAGNLKYRQRARLGGELPSELVVVTDATPDPGDMGLVVRTPALPLPAGAATQATLVTILANLVSILAELQGVLDVSGSAVTITGAVPVTDNGGSLTVDAAALPLPAGASSEATLAALNAKVTAVNTGAVTVAAALPAGNNNIGDVDVASSALPAGAATEATLAAVKTGTDKIPAAPATDRATAAAPASARLSDGAAFYKATTPADTQPVSIAAAVPVTDNAGSLTVDGTVTAQDGGGSLTVDSPQLPAALSGGRLDVVVGAALPAGANAIGKLAANAGVNIGDVAVASIAAGNNNIGDVDVVTQPARSRTVDAIAAALQTDAIMSGLTALTPKFVKVSAAGSGDLVALVAAKKIRVLAGLLNLNADGTLKLQSGGATDLTGAIKIRDGSGFLIAFSPVGNFETVAGEKLNAVVTTATQLSGWLVYVEV